MTGILVERLPADDIRDDTVLKSIEVAHGKMVEGIGMPMSGIVQFNPRRWHDSEDGTDLIDRKLLIAFAFTAGKRASTTGFHSQQDLWIRRSRGGGGGLRSAFLMIEESPDDDLLRRKSEF